MTDQFSDGWVEISGRDTRSTWFMWVDAATCTPCPPMSPEAKVVWHAMRAGAKRVNGRVFVMGVRKREYAGHGADIQLVVYGDHPAREDGES